MFLGGASHTETGCFVRSGSSYKLTFVVKIHEQTHRGKGRRVENVYTSEFMIVSELRTTYSCSAFLGELIVEVLFYGADSFVTLQSTHEEPIGLRLE